MAYRYYEQGTSGLNFDRFLDRFDENTVTKLKRHYWTAKQMLRTKMGKKEDELLMASDADLDTQLTLFASIRRTSEMLLEATHNYHGYLLDAAQAENGVGKYLKDRGKQQRRDETKKVMVAVGRAFVIASHQRAAISQPLLRFYEELCVFADRAIFDCAQTVEATERARTEYRGSLLWMKQESDELDPANRRGMERFREVQNAVRLNKERLDQLKEDTLQKVELLSASRSHLLSHLLGKYLDFLSTFYAKTAMIYTTLAKNLSVYDHYDFEILTELIEPSKRVAQKVRQDSVELAAQHSPKQTPSADLLNFEDKDNSTLRYLFGGESPTLAEPVKAEEASLLDMPERVDSPLVAEAEEALDSISLGPTGTIAGPLPALPTLLDFNSEVPRIQPPPTQSALLLSPKRSAQDLLNINLTDQHQALPANLLSSSTPASHQTFASEWDALLTQCDFQNSSDLI